MTTQLATLNQASEAAYPLTNLSGAKTLRPYQIVGIDFHLANSLTLNGDDMGLGKTIQSLIAMKDCQRVIVIVKGVTVYQWMREIADWISDSEVACFPITNAKVPILPCFQFYIVSMDTFSRRADLVKSKLFDGVIVDECHSFKNEKSKRGEALQNFFKANLLTLRTYRFKRVIFLSGTPIKNRASEFYPILHLIHRDLYPTRSVFTSRWLDYKGERVVDWKLESFQRELDSIMIRRLKSEVATDLPPFQRVFLEVDLEDAEVKDVYNKKVDLFENWLNSASSEEDGVSQTSLLGWLASLRRITATAKANLVADIVETAMEELPEGEKLCVGIHHEGPLNILQFMLEKYSPLSLTGKDSPEKKSQIAQEFTNDPSKRLIFLSMLAGGIGLNLQVCNNVYGLERQWSSADEEQFEARFFRIGQTRTVTVCYVIARKTIDQYFSDMVEEKRRIFAAVVDGRETEEAIEADFQAVESPVFDATNDKAFLVELAHRVIAGRL
jgi:SNF2 family DNA or RNA helicase